MLSQLYFSLHSSKHRYAMIFETMLTPFGGVLVCQNTIKTSRSQNIERAQAYSTQVKVDTLIQHLRSMRTWGARGILAGLFVSTPDIYQANRKCQWMPDVTSGYDASLEKPELLIHSFTLLTQFTSPLKQALHFLLSLFSLTLWGSAADTCQRSEVIGLNNGSHPETVSIYYSTRMLWKSIPVLHEQTTYHTIGVELCMKAQTL